MLMLTPFGHLGTIHQTSIRIFNNTEEVQQFLLSITDMWDSFRHLPQVFDIEIGKKPTKLSDEYHSEFIFPFTKGVMK